VCLCWFLVFNGVAVFICCGVVVLLHFYAVLYYFSPLVCLILMVECYNIFANSKKKELQISSEISPYDEPTSYAN
jgi:hypothetical protein